jgi:hypothetical protein
MSLRPLWIADLDGTISNIEHRLPILFDESLEDEEKWRTFHAGCLQDQPNTAVIRILEALLQDGHEVWIWTARSDEVEAETCLWLSKHLTFIIPLKMRKFGDHRKDHDLKKEWLDELSAADRGRIMGVLEDRSRVVKFWRDHGIQTFQVAEGDF